MVNTECRILDLDLVTVINGLVGSHDVFTICRVSGETIDCVQPEITIRSRHPGLHDGMAVYHCLRVMPLDALVTQPVITVRVGIEDCNDRLSDVFLDLQGNHFTCVGTVTGVKDNDILAAGEDDDVVTETAVVVRQVKRTVYDLQVVAYAG